jgi:hypothetical protein
LTRTRRRTILKAPHKDESYFAAEPSNSAASSVSAPKGRDNDRQDRSLWIR